MFITGPSPYHQRSNYNQINRLQSALKYDLQQDINKHENEKEQKTMLKIKSENCPKQPPHIKIEKNVLATGFKQTIHSLCQAKLQDTETL